MRIPLSWLKDYIPLDLTDEALADLLTLAGLEVDKIERTPFSFEGVVLAEIQEVRPHPNADHLKIAQVFDGKETLQIVCGDPKCSVGMQVALAPVGATLTDREGKRFKMKRSKLRGAESLGMLCSEEELGLAEHSEGIFVLNQKGPLGVDLKKLLGDVVFEISLTPNLGHCMSVLGITREIGALMDQKVNMPTIPPQEGSKESTVEVEIEEGNACSAYACRKIGGIQVGPSPKWMQKRLQSSGIRSINNIVDVTNYVMLELGQPLHAFDAKKIRGETIKVAETKQPLSFKTLDGTLRTIPENILMIFDQESPLAIAGIMGGADAQIDETTTEILLEAAHFSPSSIRKGSKTLSLRSESSIRFERGVDVEGVLKALDRATAFITSMEKGAVAEKRVVQVTQEQNKRSLSLRLSRVRQILGAPLSLKTVEALLNRLEMETREEGGSLKVRIPSYRNDVQDEIDLIEEVARLHGYHAFSKKEEGVRYSTLPHSPLYQLKKEATKWLIATGLQEIITCDLVSPKLSKIAAQISLDTREPISVLHPSCTDQSILRTSLLPGMLQVIQHNMDRKTQTICAFELGKVYFKDQSVPRGKLIAGIVLTGKRHPSHWKTKGEEIDFFDLKGAVEMVLKGLSITRLHTEPTSIHNLHPQIQGKMCLNDLPLALLGGVHPSVLKDFGIKKPVFYAEIDLEAIASIPKKTKVMTPLPQFPGSNRDWTLICDKQMAVGNFLEAIHSFPSKLLKECLFLDLYESETLGKDKKSCTVRLTYRKDTETIKQQEVDREHTRLTEQITKKFRNFID